MNYLELLTNSYKKQSQDDGFGCPPESPLEYLGDYIFQFITHDGDMSARFAEKAVEVINAINTRTTFDYIENKDNYQWYLLMLNLPFFADKTEWGTSVRGAWWTYRIKFQNCGLWDGDKQLYNEIEFNGDQWEEFTMAISSFAKTNQPTNHAQKIRNKGRVQRHQRSLDGQHSGDH